MIERFSSFHRARTILYKLLLLLLLLVCTQPAWHHLNMVCDTLYCHSTLAHRNLPSRASPPPAQPSPRGSVPLDVKKLVCAGATRQRVVLASQLLLDVNSSSFLILHKLLLVLLLLAFLVNAGNKLLDLLLLPPLPLPLSGIVPRVYDCE